MFSKACEYGIRATLYIASKSLDDERVSLRDIAKEIDSPVAFTAKIMQQVSKSGIVKSTKGPSGGFEIAKADLKKIKLARIVDAIDGDSIYRGCALGLNECDANHPCPVHFQFVAIRDELSQLLNTTSLYEVATGLKDGITFLKR
ncbi:RrF2 family transcriptional regulator [Halocola ammonii]